TPQLDLAVADLGEEGGEHECPQLVPLPPRGVEVGAEAVLEVVRGHRSSRMLQAQRGTGGIFVNIAARSARRDRPPPRARSTTLPKTRRYSPAAGPGSGDGACGFAGTSDCSSDRCSPGFSRSPTRADEFSSSGGESSVTRACLPCGSCGATSSSRKFFRHGCASLRGVREE